MERYNTGLKMKRRVDTGIRSVYRNVPRTRVKYDRGEIAEKHDDLVQTVW